MKKYIKNYPTVLINIFLLLNVFISIGNCDPFKVGFSVPLTGDLQEYGIAVKRGIEIAVDDAKVKYPNAKIEYTFEDNQYSAAKSLLGYKRLKSNNVDLIYQWGEGPLASIADIANREKFPVLAMAFDTTYSAKRNFVIRTVNSPDNLIVKLSEQIIPNGFDKSITIVKAEDPFFNVYTEGMKNHFKQIVVHDVSTEEKDFRSLILKIKNQSPSLICLFILPGQVSNFAKQMKELGVQIQIMGTDIFDSEKEVKDSNGGLNGSFFANIAVPAIFKTKYEKFKEATQIAFAYNAYESMMLIFEQFGQIQNKQVDGVQILSKLKQSSKNVFTYSEDSLGDKRYEFPLVIKKIVDGKIEG